MRRQSRGRLLHPQANPLRKQFARHAGQRAEAQAVASPAWKERKRLRTVRSDAARLSALGPTCWSPRSHQGPSVRAADLTVRTAAVVFARHRWAGHRPQTRMAALLAVSEACRSVASQRARERMPNGDPLRCVAIRCERYRYDGRSAADPDRAVGA